MTEKEIWDEKSRDLKAAEGNNHSIIPQSIVNPIEPQSAKKEKSHKKSNLKLEQRSASPSPDSGEKLKKKQKKSE